MNPNFKYIKFYIKIRSVNYDLEVLYDLISLVMINYYIQKNNIKSKIKYFIKPTVYH